MAVHRLQNYLRTYRRKSGLTQREVAFLLGTKAAAQLSRYEQWHRVPPLRTALALEAIFKIPVGEIFGGLRDAVCEDTAKRITALADEEHSGARQTRDNFLRKRKRAWLSERQGEASSSSLL